MYCGNCGEPIDPNDLFCANCGAKKEEPIEVTTSTHESTNLVHLWLIVLIVFFSVVLLVLLFMYLSHDDQINTSTEFQLEEFVFNKPDGYVSKRKNTDTESYFTLSKNDGLSLQMNVELIRFNNIYNRMDSIKEQMLEDYVVLDQDSNTSEIRYLVQSSKGTFLYLIDDLGNIGVLCTWIPVKSDTTIRDASTFMENFLTSYHLLNTEWESENNFVLSENYLSNSKSSEIVISKLN